MKNGAGTRDSPISAETARCLLSDSHMQLQQVLVQLLLAGTGSAGTEGTSHIESARRAIQIARTHIVAARARATTREGTCLRR